MLFIIIKWTLIYGNCYNHPFVVICRWHSNHEHETLNPTLQNRLYSRFQNISVNRIQRKYVVVELYLLQTSTYIVVRKLFFGILNGTFKNLRKTFSGYVSLVLVISHSPQDECFMVRAFFNIANIKSLQFNYSLNNILITRNMQYI